VGVEQKLGHLASEKQHLQSQVDLLQGQIQGMQAQLTASRQPIQPERDPFEGFAERYENDPVATTEDALKAVENKIDAKARLDQKNMRAQLAAKYFTEQNIGIINGDQPLLATVSYHHPVIKFGLKTTNQIQARKIQIHPDSIDFVLKIYDSWYFVNIFID